MYRVTYCIVLILFLLWDILYLVQVSDFILRVNGSTSLYGLEAETLDSLILDLLPPLNHSYCKLGEDSMVDTSEPVPIYLLQELLRALRSNAGFHIPRVRISLSCSACVTLFFITLVY